MNKKTAGWILCGILILLCFCVCAAQEEAGTDLVILTTTDMHGKCWETNILTGAAVPQNMLRVSTAVREIRGLFGDDRVILIDNGDTFQGTPVSEIHLTRAGRAEDEPEAMALCLTEIGYDALVLGNHEFNYSWDVMRGVYEDLQRGGVAVLAANAYYDGSDGVHAAGENAFGTYIVREVTVNGHAHRIGILGMENCDITRWDLPVNYPGMIFTHPEDPSFDQAREVERQAARMRGEGCEMIILAYHGGLGNTDFPVTFGINSENQGRHILENTDCLDLLILGHDHSTGYTNTFGTDRAGRRVPIVNGGGQDLTKTVFRLTEDPDGGLVCELLSTENLDLSAWEPDRALEEKIRPYAELADAEMDEPIGVLSGEWDGSDEFYVAQNDTIDLVSSAMIEIGSRRMAAKYGASGLEALRAAAGLDHLDVDASCSSVVNGGYLAHSGTVTTRDVYRMYRYANNLLVIPMYGRDLKAIMEENASQRLSARVLGGKVYFFAKNDRFTNLVFGIDFRYDLSAPDGERVVIDGFSNGRPFDPDALILVAVNNYNLGNERCGLRSFSDEDALWSQSGDDAGGTIQDCIREYLTEKCADGGAVTADLFGWTWSVTWSGDPAATPPCEAPAAAILAEAPLDGRRYVLCNEAQACVLTGRPNNDGLAAADVTVCGDCLADPLPGDALILTAHSEGPDTITLTDEEGRYLTSGAGGGLSLTEGTDGDGLSLWQVVPVEAFRCLKPAGAEIPLALEYYGGKIATYRINANGSFLFNFYEVTGPAE